MTDQELQAIADKLTPLVRSRGIERMVTNVRYSVEGNEICLYIHGELSRSDLRALADALDSFEEDEE